MSMYTVCKRPPSSMNWLVVHNFNYRPTIFLTWLVTCVLCSTSHCSVARTTYGVNHIFVSRVHTFFCCSTPDTTLTTKAVANLYVHGLSSSVLDSHSQFPIPFHPRGKSIMARRPAVSCGRDLTSVPDLRTALESAGQCR